MDALFCWKDDVCVGLAQWTCNPFDVAYKGMKAFFVDLVEAGDEEGIDPLGLEDAVGDVREEG